MSITQQNLPQIRRIFRGKYGNKGGNIAGLELLVILPESNNISMEQRVSAKNSHYADIFVSDITVAIVQQGFHV